MAYIAFLREAGIYSYGVEEAIFSFSFSISSTLAPKIKIFYWPTSSKISTLAPSIVPIMRPPFITNFMLLVPDASVPAVEMCSLN